MNEDDIKTTSLDQGVDSRLKTPRAQEELYKKSLDGTPIATQKRPGTDTAANETKSWTMSEIERVVSTQVMPSNKQRSSQFGIELGRRDDFRLKPLTRRLEVQLRHDFEKDIKTGPVSNRVRNFDIQSQSMRLIAANASLGSYQFQKNQVLPYMRKSLALNYEKANLLKRVVGGLGSLEKAVVAKLEAIKLNTGASAPKKVSLFKRLKLAVVDKNVDRVASNVSNLLMDNYDKQYQKYVSPTLAKLHKRMTDPSKTGGINGVSRAVTRKLNNLRRTAARLAKQDPSNFKMMGHLQQTAAKVSSGVLGGVIRLGQRSKLAPKMNGFLSKQLSTYTEMADKLKPFAPVGAQALRPILEAEEADIKKLSLGNSTSDSSMNRLLKLARDWRTESKKYQDHLLEHVAHIRQHLVPTKTATPKQNSPMRKRLPTPSKALDAAETRTFKSPFAAKTVKVPSVRTVPKTVSKPPRARPVTPLKTKVKSDSDGVLKKMFGGLTNTVKSLNLFVHKDEKNRLKQEKIKTRKDSLLNRLVSKAQARKGSYEDLKAQRDALKAIVPLGAAAALAAPHEAVGTPKDAGSGWNVPSILELAGDGAMLLGGKFLKYGWKGAKLATKYGFKGIKKAVPFLARNTGKVAGAVGGLALREAGGLGRFGGRLGLSGLAKGGKLLGSFGKRIPYLGIGLEGLDYLTGGKKLTLRNLAKSTLSLGGGALGALGGGLLTAGMGGEFVGGVGGYYAGQALGDRIFGDDQQTNKVTRNKIVNGKNKRVKTEGMGLLPSIGYGFQKFLFGDKFNNGEYKEGTSIISMVTSSIGKTLTAFGKEILDLPSQISKGFSNVVKAATNAATWAKDKVVSGAVATGKFINNKVSDIGQGISNASKNVYGTTQDIVNNLAKPQTLMDIASGKYTNFTMGISNAVLGWVVDSNITNNPSSPYYAYVTQALSAYGIKNRDQYKFINSLEVSQDKINNGQSKPFDDNDIAYMAGRFGLDSKNKEAVDYFKLWYKRRFVPAVIITSRVLKSHKVNFGSVLSTDEVEIVKITDDLKKAFTGSDILNMGLEPSAQAYNRYAKIGSSDPGATTANTLIKTKPFDPRDPNNRNGDTSSRPGSMSNGSNPYGPAGSNSSSSPDQQAAARKDAAITKGSVKDQPEFKAAYQKLPPKLKSLIDKTKSLQFVLWSTSVQHGADTAAQIFQRDYSDKLDERSYVRAIYQDRSSRFANSSSSDRIDAISHLGQEQNYVEGLWSGQNNFDDMGTMSQQVKGMVDPSGNSQMGYDSNVKAAPVTGTKAERMKDAMMYLMKKGYTKNAAAGIVGNLLMESGLNTNLPGDSGAAYGIAQWHANRRSPIERYFRKSMRAMNLHEQLDAVDWEIKGNGAGGVGQGFAQALNSAGSAEAVSRMVMQKYERPADHVTGGKNDRARASLALSALKTVGNDTGTPASKPPTASSSPAAAKPKAAPSRESSPGARDAFAAAARRSSPGVHPLMEPLTSHANDLKANTHAINAFAAAIKAQHSTPPSTHATVISPIIAPQQHNGPASIAMSMKKSHVVAGEM